MRDGRRLAAVLVVLGAACVATLPSLSWTSQALIFVTPPEGDFGDVNVGAQSGSDFTIGPVGGSDDDTITGIRPDCGAGFEVVTPPLPAQVRSNCVTASGSAVLCNPQTLTFQAFFKPTVTGLQSCNVVIEYYATNAGSGSGGTAYVKLKGNGIGVMYGMQADPPSIAFGDIPIATTSGVATIKVSNTGTSAISVTRSPVGNAAFNVTGPLTTPIAPGGSASYDVTCTPAATGLQTATVTFSDSAHALSDNVMLACNGITSDVEVIPRPVSFASALVGAGPPDKTVTIRNPGTNPVTVNSVALMTSKPTEVSIVAKPNEPFTLDPGATASVTLRYTAATSHATGSLGTMTLTVGGVAQGIAVNGEALIGAIGTTPATVEFGPICAGTPVSEQVTVYASESGRVRVSSITPPTHQMFGASPVMTDLEPRRGNEALVTVTASAADPGDYTDAFIINSNVPGKPMHDVPIHALVLPAGIAPSPERVRFGVTEVDMTTLANEVVLTNCSNSPISIRGATVQSEIAGEFALVSNPLATLQPRERHTFLVVMTPKANGTRSAELMIDHDGAALPTVVPLEGEGFGLESIDRETYYACAATHSGSAWAWPLVVTGVALGRRRRRK